MYRSPAGSAIATALASTILTIPSFALLGLLIPILGLGVAPTVIALVLYALLPIVRNTIVGLDGVDPAMTDAAKGIGMNRTGVLTRIELRLAWPAILTGMRVSTQMLMGIAAIAAYAKGPGLGTEIFSGLVRAGSANATNEALAGTLGIVVLALLVDAVYVAHRQTHNLEGHPWLRPRSAVSRSSSTRSPSATRARRRPRSTASA